MQNHYDVIIVGAGPAGLSAAIYLARAQYSVLVVEKGQPGGQVAITSEVVNYPGVLTTSGEELTAIMRRQAEQFGTQFLTAEVTDLQIDEPVKKVHTTKGVLTSLGLVAAMGANPRKIGFPGEAEFQGRGVAYCATCDGEFFTGKDIFVVGGGYAAAEEAVFLTRFARQVHMIIRKDDFSCNDAIARPAKEHPKIKISYHTEVVRVEGDTVMTKAVFRDNHTQKTWEYSVEPGDKFGLFIFAGYIPATSLLRGKVDLTEEGYVITDANQKTSVDGVYAAGDLCVKGLRQVVTAVSDGAIAATSLEKVVSGLHRQGYEKGKQNRPGRDEKPEAAKPAVQKAAPGMLPQSAREKLYKAFSGFQRKVILEGLLDGSAISRKVETFLTEVGALHENLTVRFNREDTHKQGQWYPAIRVYDEAGQYLRMQYHGVPGGHEFSSFVDALERAGSGELHGGEAEKIRQITEATSLKVLVSLTCVMCPEMVMAAQQLAMGNPLVETEVFDIAHYPTLREKYQVMSVPCLVINDEQAHFGRRNLEQIVDLVTAGEKTA